MSNKFKQRVRERMARTGESYTAARRAMEASRGTPRVDSTEGLKALRRRKNDSVMQICCNFGNHEKLNKIKR